jgi:hypothetical protein
VPFIQNCVSLLKTYPDGITVRDAERQDTPFLPPVAFPNYSTAANYSVTAVYPIYIPNALERSFENGYTISIPIAPPPVTLFSEMTVETATTKCSTFSSFHFKNKSARATYF